MKCDQGKKENKETLEIQPDPECETERTAAHLEGIKSNNGAEILCDGGWSCGQTRAFKKYNDRGAAGVSAQGEKGEGDEQADEHRAGSNIDSSKKVGG